MMSDEEIFETMHANLKFAEGLASQILAAGDSGGDAFLKAVGALAHVVYVSINEERRQEIVAKLPHLLNTYLKMLDTVEDVSAAIGKPH